MRTTAFAVLAVLGAMAIGCDSDEEPEPSKPKTKEENKEQYGPDPPLPKIEWPSPSKPVCWNAHGGSTNAAPSCKLGSTRDDFAETVRQHIVESTELNVATFARRYVESVITAYTSCVSEFLTAWVTFKKTVDCSDNYKATFNYGMHPNGTIFVDAKQSAGFNDKYKQHASEAFINVTFFWKNGTPINQDMGKMDSYLVGMRPEIQDNKAVIAYDSYGPLVELLGYGPNPPNPIVLSVDDQNKPAQAFNALVDVDGDSHVVLGDCGVTSVFDHKLPKTPVSQPLVTTLTKGESLGQNGRKATVTSFTSEKVAFDFSNAAPLAQGTVTFQPNTSKTTLDLICP